MIWNLGANTIQLREQNEALLQENIELKNLLDRDLYIPVLVEATGYAPLDPNAVEGMCYSGDPTVTASGNPSNPNRSIAASRDIPFGTEYYIPGYGDRVVEDRGGAITAGKIDIMMETRAEALAFGRQQIVVYLKRR